MRALIAMLAMFVTVSSSLAAEIKVDYKQDAKYGKECLVSHISYNGNVETGDLARLKQAYAEIQSKTDSAKSDCYAGSGNTKTLTFISLDSIGGSYLEAISILEWMTSDKKAIATYVDENAVCYSACATIFLGGQVIGYEDSNIVHRVMNPKAMIGFHAPFPVLEERNYSSKEVMDYFHNAFLIEHDFFNRAKDLGLSAEIAQFLMRPMIDEFYMIDRVGNALLLNVDVQTKFSFKSTDNSAYKIDANTALNICANSEIVGKNGDTSAIKWFFDWISENNIKPSVVPTFTGYMSAAKQPALAYVIPIQYTGEGMYRSCVVLIPTETYDGDLPKVAKPSCFGAFDDQGDIPKKILLTGVDKLADRDSSFCSVSGPLAGMHFARKISELTTADLGE